MGLKQFKALHWLYNLLHYGAVRHNKTAYRKYNFNRPLISSLSSKDFPDRESKAWLDTGDSKMLAPASPGFSTFPKDLQQGLTRWSEYGYLIVPGFFSATDCDRIWSEIENLLSKGKISFLGNKLMFANRKSELIRAVTREPQLIAILEFILNREVIPFQTIHFKKGSEQRAHSDSIHMTTYPLGFLIAAWVALEDVNNDNGPLFYYPGSHRLPYLLNNGFNEGSTALTLGNKSYASYEDKTQDILRDRPFEKQTFLARKGDVLIWHANLIHGGSPVLNPAFTRRSMVIHYFAKDVIKYHEISERPSLLDK